MQPEIMLCQPKLCLYDISKHFIVSALYLLVVLRHTANFCMATEVSVVPSLLDLISQWGPQGSYQITKIAVCGGLKRMKGGQRAEREKQLEGSRR